MRSPAMGRWRSATWSMVAPSVRVAMQRQGSQFTSTDFIAVLKDAKIAISMDGRGAWRDNVFVERLWRTVKYEEVYLRAWTGVSEARASISRYLRFYNGTRPHSSLGGQTPNQACLSQPMPIPAAA
jgi:putative transposase